MENFTANACQCYICLDEIEYGEELCADCVEEMAEFEAEQND